MLQSVKNFFLAINQLEALTKRVLYHGIQFAAGLSCLAFVMFWLNARYYHNNANIQGTVQYLMTTIVTIIVEVVIAGFVMDHFLKQKKQNQEK
ncbi:MAG: hypothetical protein H7Y41_00760 [Hyphomonadaceae bacterium]|nr:hypothetical protein [Clostridia bacterium]